MTEDAAEDPRATSLYKINRGPTEGVPQVPDDALPSKTAESASPVAFARRGDLSRMHFASQWTRDSKAFGNLLIYFHLRFSSNEGAGPNQLDLPIRLDRNYLFG